MVKEIKNLNREDNMRISFRISILLEEGGKIREVSFEKKIEMECLPPEGMDIYFFDIPEDDPFFAKRKSSSPPVCYMNKEYRGEDESGRPLYIVFLEDILQEDLDKYYEWNILKEAFISDGWTEFDW